MGGTSSSSGNLTSRQRAKTFASQQKAAGTGGRFQGRFIKGSTKVHPTIERYEEGVRELLKRRRWDHTTTGNRAFREVRAGYELVSTPPCPKQPYHADSAWERSLLDRVPWGDVPLAALLSTQAGTRLWVYALHA